MKNIPKKIYLQIDPYENGFDDFEEAMQDGITWDVKKIHDSDIAFIQLDFIEEFYQKLDELPGGINALIKELEMLKNDLEGDNRFGAYSDYLRIELVIKAIKLLAIQRLT